MQCRPIYCRNLGEKCMKFTHSPQSSCKNLPPPYFFMVHLLHRLYGVDAAAYRTALTCTSAVAASNLVTQRKLRRNTSSALHGPLLKHSLVSWSCASCWVVINCSWWNWTFSTSSMLSVKVKLSKVRLLQKEHIMTQDKKSNTAGEQMMNCRLAHSRIKPFTVGLKPSFSANLSVSSLPLLQDWLHVLPRLFTDTSEHMHCHF